EHFSRRARILLADEHDDRRHSLSQLLSERYEVNAAGDAATAAMLAYQQPPDIIVADVGMRASDRFNRLREIHPYGWKIPIIFYSTVSGEDRSLQTDAEFGAIDDLIMPFSERQLLAIIRTRLRLARVRRAAIQSLRLSEERFRTLTTMMTPGVWVAGPNAEINNELAWWWEKQTGQTPEQYAGLGYLDTVHPNDKALVLETRQESLRNKCPYQIEF